MLDLIKNWRKIHSERKFIFWTIEVIKNIKAHIYISICLVFKASLLISEIDSLLSSSRNFALINKNIQFPYNTTKDFIILLQVTSKRFHIPKNFIQSQTTIDPHTSPTRTTNRKPNHPVNEPDQGLRYVFNVGDMKSASGNGGPRTGLSLLARYDPTCRNTVCFL